MKFNWWHYYSRWCCDAEWCKRFRFDMIREPWNDISSNIPAHLPFVGLDCWIQTHDAMHDVMHNVMHEVDAWCCTMWCTRLMHDVMHEVEAWCDTWGCWIIEIGAWCNEPSRLVHDGMHDQDLCMMQCMIKICAWCNARLRLVHDAMHDWDWCMMQCRVEIGAWCNAGMRLVHDAMHDWDWCMMRCQSCRLVWWSLIKIKDTDKIFTFNVTKNIYSTPRADKWNGLKLYNVKQSEAGNPNQLRVSSISTLRLEH